MKAIQIMFKDKSNVMYENVMEWNIARQQNQADGTIVDSLVVIYLKMIGVNEVKHVEQLPFHDIVGIVYSNINESMNTDAFLEKEAEEVA